MVNAFKVYIQNDVPVGGSFQSALPAGMSDSDIGSVGAMLALAGGNSYPVAVQSLNGVLTIANPAPFVIKAGTAAWLSPLDQQTSQSLPRGSVYIGVLSAVRKGVHRVAIPAAKLALCLDPNCETLGAYMDGYGPVPVEVQPGSSKATGAVVYIRAPRVGRIKLYSSPALRREAALTVTPYNVPVLNASMGLSASHSAAGALNPIVSYVHPSLVYIEGGWNGYAYWLTATPWSGTGFPTADRYEDGMLFASNDRVTWTPINVNASGFANLTSAYVNNAGAVSTDTRLVFSSDGNAGGGTLYAYARLTLGTETVIRMQSNNGTTWTDAAGTAGAFDILTFDVGSQVEHALAGTVTGCLSPSVLYVNGAWEMWATLMEGSVGGYQQHLRFWRSIDGLRWVGGEILEPPWDDDSRGGWHSDVQYDPDSHLYVMLLQEAPKERASSTEGSTNLICTSADGIVWKKWPVPAAYTGMNPDGVNTESYFIYKGCLCRVGQRAWVVLSSYAIRDVGGNRIQISSSLPADFARPRVTRPVCSVFDDPQGRWFVTGSFAGNAGLIQREPAWATIGAGTAGMVTLANGVLSLRRDGSSACQVGSGTRLQTPYRLLFRMRLSHATSTVKINTENNGTAGFLLTGASNLIQINQSGDAGTAYVDDLQWHDWELRRSANPGGASWTVEIFRDGVLIYSAQTTQYLYGYMNIFCSGSATGQGADFAYMYRLPRDVPETTLALT